AGFSDLRPANVAESGLLSPTTEFGQKGGCDQVIVGWVRTDVSYANPCEEAEIDTRNGLLAGPNTPSEFRAKKKFVILPTVGAEAARELAKQFGIPVKPTQTSNGEILVSIANISNGQTITKKTTVIGSVNPANLKSWALEVGKGQNPSAWTPLGTGTKSVTNGVLGDLDPASLEGGVYTLRITAVDNVAGDLSFQVTFNVSKTPGTPTRTATPGPGTITPTPEPSPTVDPAEEE
ncbi:MAG TPA: hypothetical protein VFK32_05985, partial [Tepidiformaceae bacterium]|nr:hypothetical protein [Tepidiformaceae bacterium]